MKTPDRILDVDSNLQGERVEMSIDTGAMGHIMSILTELYSDAELAILREYGTNARDAHIAAGVTRPVEVTLPTEDSPALTIRDFGEGLDADDIREIYSRYGASTKRESDDAVGMLGLGCKSALAYTDQFTLSGVKGGVMTVVSVARTEDGGGDMTLVSQHEVGADVPSGVCVTVPAKRQNAFARKAHELYRFWEPGTVLVDGEPPARIGGFWVAPDLLITTEVGIDMVVMGGVPYPMFEKAIAEQYENKYRSHRRVAFVPIGAVNFVPSREQLMFNTRTRATVAEIEKRFEAETVPAFVKRCADAATAEEALEIALFADQVKVKETLTWRGKPVPTEYDFGKYSKAIVLGAEKRQGTRDDNHHETLKARELRGDVVYFSEYDGLAWSPSRREKLELWLKNQGVERPERFILITGPLPPDLRTWIGDAKVYDWRVGPPLEKAPSQRRERSAANGGTGINAGVYDVRDLRGYAGSAHVPVRAVDARDLDRSRPILYTFKNVESWGVVKEQREATDRIARHVSPDAQIVLLGLNRAAKFQRDFPRSESLEKYNARMRAEWIAKMSADDRAYLTIANGPGVGVFKSLEVDRIDDPALKEAVRIANLPLGHLLEEQRIFGTVPTGDFKDPRARYPLFPYGAVALKEREHVYLYVNAAYGATR